MDTLFEQFAMSMNGFKFTNNSSFPLQSSQSFVKGSVSDQYMESPDSTANFLHSSDSSTSSMSPSSEVGDSYENSDSNPVLKFISDMLLEEDLEGNPSNFQDSLALQAAEKSFYEVLCQKYPPNSPKQVSVDHSGESESTHVQSSSLESKIDTYLLQNSFSEFPPTSCESRFKKSHEREHDDDYLEQEFRSNKHSAIYSNDDSEPLEMFDKVLLYHGDNDVSNALREMTISSVMSKGSSKTTRTKKQSEKRDVVDLCTLLNQCAQATASYDQRTANELLKQIRQHSSPYGDGNQRLAHYFADALEARLSGTKIPMYTSHLSSELSASDILKAYQVYVTSCPFKRMSNFFANRTILKQAEKSTKLHIIDFGILYGFQWPCLIQRLSERPGGPPKLRITGIELPEPGFRPFERVEETGRRLSSYCKRFNVPFKFKVIAQKWETIQLEDLNIDRSEFTVVNCICRLRHLPDETVLMSNNPRDRVLKLIKSINPNLFIHGVVNGTYNSPFFVTRFREALFHFSALFDMYEASVPREDQYRTIFERAIYGRDIKNILACEGLERVERPETYKQWHVRNVRAGFKQLPINQEILNKVQTMVNLGYNKEYMVDVDGRWLLHGWKGRITFAISCWKAAS